MSPPDPAPDQVVAVLDDVTVRRGGATLLHRISWTIRAGERWVVIGANGAGKSTLLQAFAGTIAPNQRHGQPARRAARRGRPRRAVAADRLGERRARRPDSGPGAGARRRADRLARQPAPRRRAVRRGRHRACARPAHPGRVPTAGRPGVRLAERGRAQAGAARARRDDRPGAAPARRAGCRPRPGWPRGAAPPAGPACARPRRSRTSARLAPRRGDPRGLHPRPADPRGRGGRRRADRRDADLDRSSRGPSACPCECSPIAVAGPRGLRSVGWASRSRPACTSAQPHRAGW